MPPEVVQLKTVQQTRNEDVIMLLESALERAKAGEIVAVAIATLTADGGMNRSWSSCKPCAALIGAVAYLQQDMIADAD